MSTLLIPMAMSGIVLTVIVIIVILAVIVGVGVGMYNSLVRLRNQVQESWNQVDVELQRRHDLIPNLVETTKGYAAHERNTLEQVVALRNQAVQAGQGAGQQAVGPTPQQAQVENQLSQAVNRLLVTVEAYPDLKSNQNFIALQNALTETEDRIAAGRRYFNANVRAYNTKVESFPSSILAGMGHFQKANYFEVTDAETRQAQKVDFGPMAEVGPTISQQQAQQHGQQNFGQSYQQAYPAGQPVDPGQRGPFADQQSVQQAQQPQALDQGSSQPVSEHQGQPVATQQTTSFGQTSGQPAMPTGQPVEEFQPNNPYGNPQQ